MELILGKMKVEDGSPIRYFLDEEKSICMNNFIGRTITLEYLNEIICVSCGKATSKSFNQGFCYSCFIEAPESAECIIRPELCKAHLGEGRDPEWEEAHHNQPHVVYLAASDCVKVGVTRKTQVPNRWIDQGAKKAIILAEVPYRQLAGIMEVALKDQYTDKTNWQRMLKNEVDESIDLVEEKWNLEGQLPSDLCDYFTDDETVYELEYPVEQYPKKVKSLSFDKEKTISGILVGIKGQYLIFQDESVLNIRKHSGYKVSFLTE